MKPQRNKRENKIKKNKTESKPKKKKRIHNNYL